MIRSTGSLLICAAVALLASAALAQPHPAPFTGAFDPEEVLINLEKNIRARDWQRYGDFLAEDFRFIPFSGVYLEMPPLPWDLWDRQAEIRFIRELVSPAQGGADLSLLDNVLSRGQESRGRAEWDLVYTMHSRGKTFRSHAILVFHKIDNLWYLREWIDTTVESDPETGEFLQTSGSLRRAISYGDF